MDKVTFEFVKGIVETDTRAQGQLVNCRGQTCFIGGLYAVIDPDWADDYHDHWARPRIDTSDVVVNVSQAFGINIRTLEDCVALNDRLSKRDQRIARILKRLAEDVTE